MKTETKKGLPEKELKERAKATMKLAKDKGIDFFPMTNDEVLETVEQLVSEYHDSLMT